MKTSLRTILTASTLGLVLATAVLPAQAQKNALSALMLETEETEPAYELLMKSRVAFWKGMSRSEFESRTVDAADGARVVSLGRFEFIARGAEFDTNGLLTRISVEFRSDDPEEISLAYSAYKHALGEIKPDYSREAPAGTEEVPDLQFAMVGWKGGPGAESALARIYSKRAQAASKLKGVGTTAGIVTFAVRGI